MSKSVVATFFYLSKKSFFRGSSVASNIGKKILLGYFFVCFVLITCGLAFLSYVFFDDTLGKDPLKEINNYLVYFSILWVVIRYFFQKIPTLVINPLLLQPLSKKNVVHYALFKSTFSFWNTMNFYFFIPFGLFLVYWYDYNLWIVLSWWLVVFSLILITNYINIIINGVDRVLYLVAAVLISFFLLQRYEIIEVGEFFAPIFNLSLKSPISSLIFIPLIILSYYSSFNFFKQKFYLDSDSKKKVEIKKLEWLSLFDRFGKASTFIKNDIRLIIRSKAARGVAVMGLLFMFYGLLFQFDIYRNVGFWQVFSGIFVTGGFLLTFGQYIPSWDSSFYPLIMTQNISYKEYLISKWWMMVIFTFGTTILSSFYLFFSWKIFYAVIAGGIFNMGVNSIIILISGAYTRIPMDLENPKSFGNFKAFNFRMFITGTLPILIPLFLFSVGVLIKDLNLGFLLIASFGIIGFFFRNIAFKIVEKIYKSEKYETVKAYKMIDK